jgi:acetoin utilization deacetylase AcuC-like enzyme
MTTLLIHHHASLEHENPPGHPERVDRIKAINQILSHSHFKALKRKQAPHCRDEDIVRVHPDGYLAQIREASPEDGFAQIDMDTFMSPGSLEAALRGAGAAVAAVDAVFSGEAHNVFCAMRPPGHHAESHRPMGFCLFNNAAIAAHHARDRYDAERVAVVDFDVHHGNGTQEIFWSDANLFYGSTHQMPLYPGTGAVSETGVGNIFNAPLQEGDGGAEFRNAMSTIILPALDAFGPDLLIISAGFDAHRADPLGGLNFSEEDYVWATLNLMDIAEKHAESRVVSVLEGGYDLRALAASVAVHVQALIRGTGDLLARIPDDEVDDDGH